MRAALTLSAKRLFALAVDLTAVSTASSIAGFTLLILAWKFPDFFSQKETVLDAFLIFPVPIIIYESGLIYFRRQTLGMKFFKLRVNGTNSDPAFSQLLIRSILKWGPVTLIASIGAARSAEYVFWRPESMFIPWPELVALSMIIGWSMFSTLALNGEFSPYDLATHLGVTPVADQKPHQPPSRVSERLIGSGFLAVLFLTSIGIAGKSFLGDEKFWLKKFSSALAGPVKIFVRETSQFRMRQRRPNPYETDLVTEADMGALPLSGYQGKSSTVQLNKFTYQHLLAIKNPTYFDIGWYAMKSAKSNADDTGILTNRGIRTIMVEYSRMNEESIKTNGLVNVVLMRSVERAGLSSSIRLSLWIHRNLNGIKNGIEFRKGDSSVNFGALTAPNIFTLLRNGIFKAFGFIEE